MTQEAIYAGRRTRALARDRSLAEALRAFALSRLLVAGAALVGAFALPADRFQERAHDVPSLTGSLGTAWSALARWDATWYLSIAQSGYGGPRSAFFPLYPLAVRTVAGFGSSAASLLLSAYAVSAVAFLAALYLLHRLAELELGARRARLVLLLVAMWPASFFFSAPYSESLFLALSVGMFYAARTGRFGWAAVLCALATAARPTGVLLLLPLALLLPSGRRAWLLLAPSGVLAFCGFLWLDGERAFGWLHTEQLWGHRFKGPWGGVHDALWAGARGLAHLDQLVAVENVLYLAFLAVAVVATIGLFRRLPPAYGAYTAASLLVAVSAPVSWQPLMSFGRLLAVLFPIPMWLALRGRAVTWPALAASSALLACATALFASWHLVT